MSSGTGRDSDKFMLRLPDGMRNRLKSEAAENNRSLNAEIVARLERSLSDDMFPGLQEQTMERVVERVIRRVVTESPSSSDNDKNKL